MPKITPRSRYKKERKILRWNTDELMCLKMLAYVLRKYEAEVRNMIELWNRVEELCPRVIGSVLNTETSFKQIREATFQRTGIKITPNRLYQRSDKAERYGEFNIHLSCVEAAYLATTKTPKHKPSRRSFTDAQVAAALEKQGGRCYYRGCDCSDGVVGDHIVPYSLGGPTELFNCAASCYRCNQEKGSKSVLEFGKLIGAQNAKGRKLCK